MFFEQACLPANKLHLHPVMCVSVALTQNPVSLLVPASMLILRWENGTWISVKRPITVRHLSQCNFKIFFPPAGFMHTLSLCPQYWTSGNIVLNYYISSCGPKLHWKYKIESTDQIPIYFTVLPTHILHLGKTPQYSHGFCNNFIKQTADKES